MLPETIFLRKFYDYHCKMCICFSLTLSLPLSLTVPSLALSLPPSYSLSLFSLPSLSYCSFSCSLSLALPPSYSLSPSSSPLSRCLSRFPSLSFTFSLLLSLPQAWFLEGVFKLEEILSLLNANIHKNPLYHSLYLKDDDTNHPVDFVTAASSLPAIKTCTDMYTHTDILVITFMFILMKNQTIKLGDGMGVV